VVALDGEHDSLHGRRARDEPTGERGLPLALIFASRARTGVLGSSPNTDAKVAHQMLLETVGLVGSQNPPSIDHRPTRGLVLPAVLSAVTKVGRSGVVVAQSTVASAPDVATLPATAAAVPSPVVNELCETT